MARQEAIIELRQAQDELRAGYIFGAPGVAVSGLVWLIAGMVWTTRGAEPAFAVLFIGGVAIFPLSLLVARAVFRAAPVAKSNPLNVLGFETTVPLFAGLFTAMSILKSSPPLAFALFAAIVGARYFAFSTLYRVKDYWLLGGLIFAIGILFAQRGDAIPVNVALCVGAVELAFAALIFWRARSTRPAQPVPPTAAPR